jgi:Ca2+/Na+ antiporter
MFLTDNELTNILGAVLVLAVVVHTIAQIVIPIALQYRSFHREGPV